jgi:hypothetical protein
MPSLFLRTHTCNGWIPMTKQTNRAVLIRRPFLNGWEPSASSAPADQSGWGKLEVNVVFTEAKATMGALKVAGVLAKDLRAKIRLLAPQAVPFGFPLESPPVAVDHTEKLLLDLASQGMQGPIETTVHLYLCRDRLDTLGQVLKPNSLVIVGGKSWWPNDASYLARMLRSIGHHVILVSRKTAANELKPYHQSRAELHEVIRHA